MDTSSSSMREPSSDLLIRVVCAFIDLEDFSGFCFRVPGAIIVKSYVEQFAEIGNRLARATNGCFKFLGDGGMFVWELCRDEREFKCICYNSIMVLRFLCDVVGTTRLCYNDKLGSRASKAWWFHPRRLRAGIHIASVIKIAIPEDSRLPLPLEAGFNAWANDYVGNEVNIAKRLVDHPRDEARIDSIVASEAYVYQLESMDLAQVTERNDGGHRNLVCDLSWTDESGCIFKIGGGAREEIRQEVRDSLYKGKPYGDYVYLLECDQSLWLHNTDFINKINKALGNELCLTLRSLPERFYLPRRLEGDEIQPIAGLERARDALRKVHEADDENGRQSNLREYECSLNKRYLHIGPIKEIGVGSATVTFVHPISRGDPLDLIIELTKDQARVAKAAYAINPNRRYRLVFTIDGKSMQVAKSDPRSIREIIVSPVDQPFVTDAD